MLIEKFTIHRHPEWDFLGDITVSIQCDPLTAQPIKLGRAVKKAVNNGVSLSGALLAKAHLIGANLASVDLNTADLRGARLYGAQLHAANLTHADLRGAYLDGVHLNGANLKGAFLNGAIMYGEEITSIFARVQREIEPYQFMGVELKKGGYKIAAGCRWFTDAEYHDHIARNYPNINKASETLTILDFIAARAKALGIGESQ